MANDLLERLDEIIHQSERCIRFAVLLMGHGCEPMDIENARVRLHELRKWQRYLNNTNEDNEGNESD